MVEHLYSLGSSFTAPTFCDEINGVPNWSGLSESRFTTELKNELIAFMKNEGRKRGYEDASINRVGVRLEFFHPEFMDGVAQLTWKKYYMQGVANYELDKRYFSKQFFASKSIKFNSVHSQNQVT